jgi:uncharacterized protein (TIGR01777 family)
MQISMSGATGFIGNMLKIRFIEKGWTVNVINRESLELNDKEFLEKKIEGSDVVINLAGAPVLKRWSESYKKEIYHSRIDTTRKLATAIRNSSRKPFVFISGSAIGIYDTTETHTEESQHFSDDFMGKVCRDWEHEALEATGSTRVVIFRTGVVLGTNGGALQSMYTPFKLGLGGIIGNGKQAFSWIHATDLINAFLYTIEAENFSGIINAVAPEPTINYHFTKTLGKVLIQPTITRVPEFALKLIYGEGSRALTSGQKVLPEKLLTAGFIFKFPTIEKALLDLYKM